MIEFYLKVRISKRKKAGDRWKLLGEYFSSSKHIYVYLYNLKPFKWHKFLSTFNGLIEHEMTHHFLRNIRGRSKIKERICKKMEINEIWW